MEHLTEHKKGNELQAAAVHKKSKALSLTDNRPQTTVQRKFASPSSDAIQLVENNNTVVQLVRGGPPIPGAKKSIGKSSKKEKEDKSPKAKYQNVNTIVLYEYSNIKTYYSNAMLYIDDIASQLDIENTEDVKKAKTINTFQKNIESSFKKAENAIGILNELIETGRPTRDNDGISNTLVTEIISSRQEIIDLYSLLQKEFPFGSEGYGGKGRAHDMDVEINPETAPEGKTEDNHFTKEITLGSEHLKHKVYKTSKIAANEATGPIIVKNRKNPDESEKSSLRKGLELSPVKHPQYEILKSTPKMKLRGKGQASNMNNTNAAGYAWLMNIPLGGQRWEWLHIRGAGLGGDTDATNLITGTRDANTHMIPFESNIRTLGTLVRYNQKLYKELHVEWNVSSPLASHAYEKMIIGWDLIGQDNEIKASGRAIFRPLHTGSNISKTEIDALEKAIKEVKDSLPVE